MRSDPIEDEYQDMLDDKLDDAILLERKQQANRDKVMTGIVPYDAVVEDAIYTLRLQSAKGFTKYDKSMEENDGDLSYWVQQAIEESADLLHYLTKIKRKLDEDE